MHEKIIEAINYMIQKHGKATRRGSRAPYFIHPLNVMNVLLEEQGYDHTITDDVVIAGILHDLNEDANISIKELEKKFGKEVGRLVNNVSEPEQLKKELDQKNNWKARKEHLLESMKSKDRLTKMLFCADLLDNVMSISRDVNVGIDIWKQFHASKEEKKWYYTSTLKALKSGDSIEKTRMYRLLEIEIKKVCG